MKKSKKTLLLFLCGVMSVITLGLGACKDGDNKDDGIIPSTSSVVEENKASLSLNMKNVTLPLFGKTTIVATLKNSTAPIVWTSSNADIVTVNNGEIYGRKEGTATITVTAGELSETCSVTVTKEGVAIQFAMLEDGMTLYLGAPYKLDPTVISNGEVVEGVDVTFTTEGDVFTLDADGNVTLLKEGEQQITATAVAGGVTVINAIYTVKVKEYLSIRTGIEANTLNLMLTNYHADSVTEYSIADFKAVIGSQTRDDIEFTYEVKDDTIAKLENKKILPLKAGETTVCVSFTSPITQNVYQENIRVVVGKETVVKPLEFLAKSATGTRKSDFQDNLTGVTEINLSGTDIDLTRLTEVREKGKKLVAYPNGDILKVTNASCGEVELEVELDNVIYKIDGFIAQTLISNKAELQKFYTEYASIWGYTVLTADIDMKGDVLDGGTQWFRCIFDGRGHTISNFKTQHGIVTYLSEGACIKNVQYVNVVKDAGAETEFNGENIGAYGLFGYQHTGSIRDVLVVGTIKNPAQKQAVFCGGEYAKAEYKNIVVVVDVENAQNTTLIGTGAYYSGTGSNNRFENMRYVYDGEMLTCADYADSKDALHYTSISSYVATKDFDTFNEYWTISNNSLPVMRDLTQYFENSAIFVDGSFEIGQTVTIETTMACSTIYLKNQVAGITLLGNTLTIGTNVALGTSVTLVVVNSINAVRIEKTFTLRATETLTYAEKYVDAMDGQGKLDLSKLNKTIGEVKSVTINGLEQECETKNGILYYDTFETGNLTIVLNTDTCAYAVEILQADNVIKTAGEFKAWADKNDAVNGNFTKGTYTVLANDISWAGMGKLYTGSLANGRVFDGLGHTIDGFIGGMGIVQSLNGGTATWKNVNYTNYTGEFVFYIFLGGIYENVNITGTVTSADALLAYTINRSGTVIRNCVFNINHTTAGTALNLAKKGASYNEITLTDTTIVYGNGQLTTTDLDLSKGSNYYLYDIDDVNTNYYAKVSGGTATFPLSQMGASAIGTVSKLLVNGVEVQATIANGNLTYPASNTGSTTLIITTDKGVRVMNIVHADNVLTSWSEFNAWINSTTEYNKYNYTVLTSDITASGKVYSNGGYFEKTFDGLGHTIDNFNCGHGIVQRLLSGATWKNVNYTNLTAGDQGVFGYLSGGTFENVTISGKATGSRILCFGINNQNTKIVNCLITLTSDDNAEKYLATGTTHYWGYTLINTTINYSGKINTTCDCGCGEDAKITLTNSKITSNYTVK